MITKKEFSYKNIEYVLYDYNDGGKPELYQIVDNTLINEGDGFPSAEHTTNWLYVSENYEKILGDTNE